MYSEVLPVIFEHKIADCLSIPQHLYNHSTTYPKIPPNTQVYSLNDIAKQKVYNNYYGFLNHNINRNLEDPDTRMIITKNIPLYYKLEEIITVDQNPVYVNIRNPLLEGCNHLVYNENMDKFYTVCTENANDSTCVTAIYKKYPLSVDSSTLIDSKLGFDKNAIKYIKYRTKYIKYRTKYLNLKKSIKNNHT
jgi:hypothetical protein